MILPRQLSMAILLLSVGFLIFLLAACGGGSNPVSMSPATSPAAPAPSTTPVIPPGLAKIHHVDVIVQENRTPDNLFHGLPNADIANSGMDSTGQEIPLTPAPLATNYDLGHSHQAFLEMYNGGVMNGADKVHVVCNKGAAGCPGPHPQFRYVDPAEVRPYLQLAEQYTFADRMFQTNQGPSFPAHQFILSGTSAPNEASELFAAENPFAAPGIPDPQDNTGCSAPPQERVAMIDPEGSEAERRYPCFDHKTLTDLLDNQNISWRYYTPLAGSIWTAPNAIQHMRFGPAWANVILNQKQVLTDVASGHLPQVSWVIPTGQASDHAAKNTGLGPSWVAAVVNAIGTSAYWPDTAIFITWDDWGGWYDHVAPQIYDSYEYGFRVPLIVVSPFAKTGYVSHATHDFGSILKFIEETFNLPSLGFADSRADNLADCFDFNHKPVPYKSVQAKHDANYFLHETSAPEPPDDD